MVFGLVLRAGTVARRVVGLLIVKSVYSVPIGVHVCNRAVSQDLGWVGVVWIVKSMYSVVRWCFRVGSGVLVRDP